jgi:hypothetical protein
VDRHRRRLHNVLTRREVGPGGPVDECTIAGCPSRAAHRRAGHRPIIGRSARIPAEAMRSVCRSARYLRQTSTLTVHSGLGIAGGWQYRSAQVALVHELLSVVGEFQVGSGCGLIEVVECSMGVDVEAAHDDIERVSDDSERL